MNNKKDRAQLLSYVLFKLKTTLGILEKNTNSMLKLLVEFLRQHGRIYMAHQNYALQNCLSEMHNKEMTP